MSAQELKQLSDHPLFTIGGHTTSHRSLSHHPEEVQKKEITDNREYLENLLGTHIDHFAYPSGNFNATTLKLLKKNNFTASFSTNSQPVEKHSSLYKINRFQVMDWGKKKFELNLKNWLRL